MTLSEIRAEVRTRLAEASSTFWTDAEIDEAINEGYEEISDGSEWFERHANVRTVTDHMFYDLRSVLPDEFLSLRRIQNTTTTRWLEPGTTRAMDGTYRQWEVNRGEPNQCWMRGNFILSTWPMGQNDNTTLRIYYTAIPAPLVHDDDRPGFPEEFHDGLIDYAVFKLLSIDAETVKALENFASYKAVEDALASRVGTRTKSDTMPALQGDDEWR